MRKIYSIFILVIFMSGCNDSYLELFPEDKVTDANYWKTASDIKMYANQFYADFFRGGGYIWPLENNTDNLGPSTRNSFLWGESIVPTSGGGWGKGDWLKIRRVNYGLARIGGIEESSESLMYEGELRFFKAKYYYDKLVEFGDVPWFDKDLNIDSDELYNERDSRETVMSKMIEDLNFAIEHLPDESSSNRLTKYAALAFKAEVCLFEGTFRKYHNLGNYEILLQDAADAAKNIIDSGLFSVYTTGDPHNDYFNLFVQYDLSGNSEAIMFIQYITDVFMHNQPRYFGETGSGYTKDFVESYLCTDGKPISISNLYIGDEVYENEFVNRDPRMRQSIHTADRKYRIYPDGSFNMKIPPIFQAQECYTGYEMIKGYSPYEVDRLQHRCVIDQFIFRFGKVLLDYAEAKAELGEATQEVLDRSVNLLRDRVNMPHLKVNVGFEDPNWPNWEVPVSPLINEIRRERRIEITIEGPYRWHDILRWKAGKLLENKKTQLGAYDPNTGDYRVLYPGYERKWYNRLYLKPIPKQDLVLNPNLNQNPGWEDY